MRYLLSLLFLSCCLNVSADDPPTSQPEREPVPAKAVKTAIRKAIPLLEQGATVSASEKTCYTCHNQGLPVLALTALEKRGFSVDHQVVLGQVEHTLKHLVRGRENYQAGKGQGGQVMTAGYALWTLDAGGWPADETTAAVTHYLLVHQRDKQRWLAGSQRPPSSGSSFTATYIALRGLEVFGSDTQQDDIKSRRQAAGRWIIETEPRDTEDRVFQLRSLPYVTSDQATLASAVDKLLALQHAGGGWAQTKDMQPDAYATGTVLTALQETGGLPTDHPAIMAGFKYLLDTQQADGSWHVVTRAEPIQDYYESGFPHGEDQFISIAATGWAVLALAHALPTVANDQISATSSQ